jgi:hypothetical protein
MIDGAEIIRTRVKVVAQLRAAQREIAQAAVATPIEAGAALSHLGAAQRALTLAQVLLTREAGHADA